MHTVGQEEELQAKIRATDPKLIGERIKQARRELNETLDTFAKSLGTDRSHIIKLEKGVHRPHARTLLRIAAKTGREPEFFVGAEVTNGKRPFRSGSG